MANWTNPLTTSLYANFVQEVKDRDLDLAVMFDPAVTTPTITYTTGMMRYDSANGFFQRHNGTVFANIGSFSFNITGSSAKWTTPRTLSIAGDATGSASVDGSANASISVTLGTVPATKGGSGFSSYAVGDILYANTTTTMGKLPGVAAGNVLLSAGVGVPPNYGQVGLTTHVTGTLGIGNGGTGATTEAAARTALDAARLADQGNWPAKGVIDQVVGQLAWKNYSTGHTIFDASAGLSPNGTAVNNTDSEYPWIGTYPTLMGWNGGNTFGVRVDVARHSESCSGNAATVSNLTLSNTTNLTDTVSQNAIGYVAGIALFGQFDGALYSQRYSTDYQHQIFGDYRTGQLAVRGKTAGVWQAWRAVVDSSNIFGYCPSLTGAGASGSWSINAATVTNGVYTNGTTSNVNGVRFGKGASEIATNVTVGNTSLNAITSGHSNTAVGDAALSACQTGSQNVAIGRDALAASTASGNVAIGSGAMYLNTTGTSSVAMGVNALLSNTTGIANTALGASALTSATASNNTGVGASALLYTTTGASNSAVGSGALLNNTTGASNVAMGVNASGNNTTGGQNIAIGNNALLSVQTTSSSTAVGHQALVNAFAGASNTALGYNAGNNLTSGSNNTVIGNSSAASSASVSNEITLGNGSIATLRCQVTSITALSDARDKANVQPIKPNSLISRLRPVTFDWNARDGAKVGIADSGFIAQELQQAQIESGVHVPNLVMSDNPEKLEAAYGYLLPYLVAEIQRISASVAALQENSTYTRETVSKIHSDN